MDLTAFSTAITDIVADIGTTVLPAMASVAVAGLGVSLVVGWIRRVRSAV